MQVFGDIGRTRIGAIHFALERLELSKGDVAGAALRCGGVATIKRGEGLAALAGKVGFKDIGGRVKVALGVAAHQLLILGEGHITLENTGPHTGGGPVGFFGMLGKLQRSPPVTDGKVIGLLGSPFGSARLERLFDWPIVHVIHEVIGAWAQLHRACSGLAMASASGGRTSQADSGQQSL